MHFNQAELAQMGAALQKKEDHNALVAAAINSRPINWNAPPKQRPIAEQIASLAPAEMAAFTQLRAHCKAYGFPDDLVLRLIRASPGATKFNVATASKVADNLFKWNKRVGVLGLTIRDVRAELERGCLSVPGMCNAEGHLTLYMVPAKFSPGKDSLDELMRSLVYLLQCMSEDERVATVGLSFVANMDGWGWSNWGVRYAKNFFDTMQGRYPIRVRQFVILNPPAWFGVVWKAIRGMMSVEFAAKVSMPPLQDAASLFPSLEHVPVELGGSLDTKAALDAFIRHRYKVEGLDYNAPYAAKGDGAGMAEAAATR